VKEEEEKKASQQDKTEAELQPKKKQQDAAPDTIAEEKELLLSSLGFDGGVTDEVDNKQDQKAKGGKDKDKDKATKPAGVEKLFESFVEDNTPVEFTIRTDPTVVLPEELYVTVFSFLDIKSLARIREVRLL